MTNQPTITNPETETPPFDEPLRVEFWHDYDTDSPNEYGLFRLISFGRRHLSYEDPDRVLACQYEYAEDPEDPDYLTQCERGPHPETNPDPDDWDQWPAHEYRRDPDIVAFLSYFEHSLCRWSRMGHGPADYGGFDTVGLAGVLVFNDRGGAPADESEKVWFRARPEDEQLAAIDSFLEEYTDWANGSCYGFAIESVTRCSCCNQRVQSETDLVESGGGFIGDEYIVSEVRAILANAWNIEPDELQRGRHYEVFGECDWIMD